MQDERHQMRQCMIDAWQKREQKERATPLELQLIDVIHNHPEYHTVMENKDTLDKDYRTDNNPFLHISMHLGLIEQLTTNRPNGIRTVYQTLYEKYADEHQVQHMMMEAMAETIWDAQQNQQLPNETHYLEKLGKLTACLKTD